MYSKLGKIGPWKNAKASVLISAHTLLFLDSKVTYGGMLIRVLCLIGRIRYADFACLYLTFIIL